jgi:hypothetical protein
MLCWADLPIVGAGGALVSDLARESLIIAAPNQRSKLVLDWETELSFGPVFYSLWLTISNEDKRGPGRSHLYTGFGMWSDDSELVVVRRWAVTFPDDPSLTRAGKPREGWLRSQRLESDLCIIDVRGRRMGMIEAPASALNGTLTAVSRLSTDRVRLSFSVTTPHGETRLNEPPTKTVELEATPARKTAKWIITPCREDVGGGSRVRGGGPE